MQIKLVMLAIVLTMCGCVSSPAPDPDTGFYESSFGDGSSIKAKQILQIGAARYWIVEITNKNKKTTLLRCANNDGHTMTVLNSEELQPETTYGEKNGR